MGRRGQIQLRSNDGAGDLFAGAPLAMLVVLYGVVISAYTVLVHQFASRGTAEDCIKKAALTAANDLERITVNDPVYGRVGLCDFPDSEKTPGGVIGLNTIYATIRVDHEIAKKLALPYMSQLVQRDAQRAHDIEQRLRSALLTAVPTNEDAGIEPSAIVKTARSILGQTQRSDQLSWMRIRLGSTVAPPNLAIGDHQWAQQYQVASLPQLVNETTFAPSTTSTTPSVVLVEAEFKSTTMIGAGAAKRTLSACAVVGAPPVVPARSAFMISFPHGLPPIASCLKDLLADASSAAHTGNWMQALEGDVPGRGHLAVCNDGNLEDMQPDAAVQTALYHWLRSQRTQVNPESVWQLASAPWLHVRPQAGAATTDAAPKLRINSALTKDTGARTFAFLNQTAPGSSGQPALRAAFAGSPPGAAFPASAIPLQIDSGGRCNIAGRKGCDWTLLKSFLEDVYKTNSAASESAVIARTVQESMRNASEETQREIARTNEELNSVSSRLGRAATVPASTRPMAEIRRLRHSQIDLIEEVQDLRTKLEEYRVVASRADAVLLNAQSATKITFELASKMSSFASDGIFRTHNPNGYLLKDGIVFCPIAAPAGDGSFFDEIAAGGYMQAWASNPRQFSILQRPNSATQVESVPFNRLASLRANDTAQPRFVIFDSKQLNSASAAPVVLTQTPFGDSGITDGEGAYYAADAYRSGFEPSVAWSLLIRDLAAFNRGRSATVPSAVKWCAGEQFAAAGCPELAVEVQLRSPMPVIPGLPIGPALTDRVTGQQAWQIPPTPVGML